MTRPSLAHRSPLIVSVFLLCLIVLVAGSAGVYVLSDPGLSDAINLTRVATVIDQVYEHNVDWNRLIDAGMREMFSHLDPYSGYMDQRRWSRMHEELSGSYTGIGVTVTSHDEGLLIISVREDGPAAAAGILSGDVVVGVDSTTLHGLDIVQATDILRGAENTEVTLTVYRPVDGDTISVRVRRQKIDFVHIPFAGFTPDTVIYIRLLDFDAGASVDLRAALDSLLARPGVKPVGVILDLCDNPGGLFSEAYQTANLFLEKDQFIVGTDGRSRWNEERHFSSGPDITKGLPLAIIVDRGSASASEILAGSLSQLGRAVLVGDTTFGKGLVQGFSRLYDGSALRLTVSRYYLPDSLYLNEFDSTLTEIGHGLVPDYLFRSQDQEPFARALERSLLLPQFAARNQDEIVAQTDQFDLDDSWVNRFKEYAESEGFTFRSSTTEQAETFADLAALEETSPKIRQLAKDLAANSRRIDQDQFTLFGDYIKRRLKQVALERRFGSYFAYLKAIVPSRPDILFATGLLKTTHE
jgi:carboxyl-terminal processing protease